MLTDQDVEKIRADFPHLETCIYLNTGATGLAAPGTGGAAAAFYERMLSHGYDAADEWRQIAVRVRKQLASLMNVAPDEIFFASTSTDALNRVAQSLPVRAGDRVVLASDEFPTLEAIARDMEARGAKVVPVTVEREAERTDLLCEAAKGARYLFVSHIHWSTGTRVDMKRLSRACSQSGAYLIVDGVHAIGSVPVDASLADVYAISFFKWTLAGFGLGAAVVRGPLSNALVPSQRGYANPAPSRSLQHSHLNYPGLAALECALDYLAGIGWDNIFERVSMLQKDIAGRLTDAGFEVLTPQDAGGLTCVAVTHPDAAASQLGEQGIRISPRGRALRVSTHFYNLPSESIRFCEALDAVRSSDP